jgi:hypothetical protein
MLEGAESSFIKHIVGTRRELNEPVFRDRTEIVRKNAEKPNTPNYPG